MAITTPTPPSGGQFRSRLSRAALTTAMVAGMGAAALATGGVAHASNPSCVSFDSSTQSTSTGVMSCDVPAGVTTLNVVSTGAGGGGGSGARTSTGGNGAVVTTAVTVTPGETLTLQVGTGGGSSSGDAGGGGGGWSAVRRGSTNLVIAGGGGGGGTLGAGTSASSSLTLSGGNAGTPAATDGLPAQAFNQSGDYADAGAGATTTAGGIGGATQAQAGGTGSAGSGGNGGEPCSGGGSHGGAQYQGGTAVAGCVYGSGGGGGAGTYGGGGGAGSFGAGSGGGASGGGGSSSVASGSAVYALATNGGAFHTAGGAGRIQLSAPAPTVSGIAPASGVVTGGTSVTVTGTNFGGGTTVTIGGQACTSPTVNSSTSLTCTAPAGSAGAANVVVTSAGQSATLTNGYTYVLGAPGAPTSVVATAGTSSVTVTWAAPTSGGTITRYEVRTAQGQAICTTTTLSCVLGAEAGIAYGVTVVAIGPAGTGAPGQATSGVVSSPVVATTAPTNAPLTLTTDKGQITKAEPGEDIVVIGTGFAPYSTATIVIYSTPTVLGTVVTDGSGNFSRAVTVPASLAAGAHNLVATGVDPQGASHAMRMEVTVAAGGAGGRTLAATGFSAGTPLALGGLLLTVGVGLAVAGRRRGGRVDA